MSPGQLSRRWLLKRGGAAATVVAAGAVSRWALAHGGDDHPTAPAVPGTPEPTAAVRQMVDGQSGVAGLYLTIANAGSEPDALLGGTTAVCGTVEPHAMRMDGDLMVMEFLPAGLPVPAGGSVTLRPDGDHVMLVGLTRDLRPDTTFLVSLAFQRAGVVECTSSVRWVLDPDDTDGLATPVTAGDLTISRVWSRPAPMISASADLPATPGAGH